MLNSDHFRMVVTGPGGRGCQPKSGEGAVLWGAQLIVHLQLIVWRRISAHDPLVRSCARRFNAIVESAEITGMERAFSDDVRIVE